MKKILRIAIYVRVSTEEQKKFGFSIAAQLDKLRKWCADNGYILVAEFVDEGYTAGNMKRPALLKMLSRLNEFDVIAFTRLDRFSRNVLEANKMLEMLNQNKVGLISIEEDDIDTTTADGLFIFQLKVSLAEREIRKTSERIKSVFDFKVKQGQVIFGMFPYGYKVGEVNGKKVVVKDEEAEDIINASFECFRTHHSISLTRDIINKMFKLERSYTFYNRLFKKPFYTGEYKGNPNYCPPYISKEEFEHNQVLISRNIRQGKRRNVFLFSSVVKCPLCGTSMVGQYRSKQTSEYYYYRCPRRYREKLCTFSKAINENKIESYLLENVERLVEDYLLTIKEVKPIKKDNSRARISEIKEEMDILNYQSRKKRISMAEYDKEFEALEKELEILLRNAPQKADTSHLRDFLNSGWRNIYDSLSRENKRALWQNIIKEIQLDTDLNITVIFL